MRFDLDKSYDLLSAWLLSTVASVWHLFVSKFTALWDTEGLRGDLYPALVFGPEAPAGPESLKHGQSAWFARLFQEVLGFSGEKIMMVKRAQDENVVAGILATRVPHGYHFFLPYPFSPHDSTMITYTVSQ